jgi:hypothetical protein
VRDDHGEHGGEKDRNNAIAHAHESSVSRRRPEVARSARSAVWELSNGRFDDGRLRSLIGNARDVRRFGKGACSWVTADEAARIGSCGERSA